MKEGNVLFNEIFKTFYLWLSDITYEVKDRSHAKREIYNRHFMADTYRLTP